MSKRPVPDEVMDAWFHPATTSPAIRRDLASYVTSVPPRPVLLEWAERAHLRPPGADRLGGGGPDDAPPHPTSH